MSLLHQKNMKILLAAEIFPPDIGGPATYALEMASWFKQKKYDFEVLCYGEDTKKYDFPITRIKRKLPLAVRYIKYTWHLFKKLKNYDLIYAQGPIASGVPAYIIKIFFGRKYIVKVVGDYGWETAQNSGATNMSIDEFQKNKMKGKIGILQYLQKMVCKKANAVIVPSYYLKNIVLGWGVDEKRIHVVYNAFYANGYKISVGSSPRTVLSKIVSAGRLVPWKGFAALIRAMPEFLKINPLFTLTIFGNGPDEKSLFDTVRDLGLENKVNIACMKRSDIYSALPEFDIFMLNTGYEGLSHTILECLSLGLPVLTTRMGGNPEIIEDGKTGILFDYNDTESMVFSISRIYHHPELREEFKKNAKETLKKFDFDSMIQLTIKVLENI